MTPWEELLRRLPLEMAQALTCELAKAEAEGLTGEVALVIHLRRGHPLSWQAGKAKWKAVLDLDAVKPPPA